MFHQIASLRSATSNVIEPVALLSPMERRRTIGKIPELGAEDVSDSDLVAWYTLPSSMMQR